MSFQGSLRDFYLPEFIHVAEAAGKTGRFVLEQGGKVGLIYLEDGNMVHAEVDNLVGDEAVYEMAVWVDGSFVFEPGVPAPNRTIRTSNANLLIHASRFLDEWRVLSKKIPSVDMVPEFVPQGQGEVPQISLSTKEWVLLSKVNGKRNIRTIAAEAGLRTFDACKLLYGLMVSGLLQIKEPSPAEEVPEAQPQAAPEPAPVEPEEDSEEVDVDLVVSKIREICEGVLGHMGESLIDRQLRRAGVKSTDRNLRRQVRYLRKALRRINKQAASLVGPDAAAQMVLKMEEWVDKLDEVA